MLWAVRTLVKVRSPAPRPAAAHCVATRLSNTNVFWRHSGEVAARRSQPDISPAAPPTHSILDISIRMYLFVFWQLEPDQIQYIDRKVAAVCRAAGYVVTLVHNSTANLSGTSSFSSIDQIRVDDDWRHHAIISVLTGEYQVSCDAAPRPVTSDLVTRAVFITSASRYTTVDTEIRRAGAHTTSGVARSVARLTS